MVARALWKGSLRFGAVDCAIGLYTAVTMSDRIALNIVNRKTRHPVNRRYVDAETGELVPREDEVKGYELDDGRFVQVTAEEIAAAIPESDKLLTARSFLRCADIDKVYFDKPYHLAPAEEAATPVYRAIVAAMEDVGVAALAQAVLFRRLRNLLVRADEGRLIATTLHYDYEVRPAAEVFADVEALEIKGEMLDLARHIVRTRTKTFDPATIEDRYEAALAELVAAKAAGKPPPRRRDKPRAEVVDLMQALRDSAGAARGADDGRRETGAKRGRAKPAQRRKAG